MQFSTAHSFGRFGFNGFWKLPGMNVSKIGIQSEVQGANILRFDQPAKTWRASQTSQYGQSVNLTGTLHCPSKLEANLFSPCVRADFDKGLSIIIHCRNSPFLTWKDGSVAANVPTPNLSWVLLSFDESQPPVLLSLPSDKNSAFKIVGKTGRWKIITTKPYSGWMKIGYPFGDKSIVTSNASEMGNMVNEFLPEAAFWLQDAPQLLGVRVQSDRLGVTGEWSFSEPPMLPPAVMLSRKGGYNLQVITPLKLMGYSTNEGPIVESSSTRVKIRFPDQEIPVGRFLVTNQPEKGSIPQVENVKQTLYAGFVNLGIKLLASARTQGQLGEADDDYQNLLFSAQYNPEVWTGDRLTYGAHGEGLMESSAIAFLNQCKDTGQNLKNPLLTSIFWSQDWFTWLPLFDQADQETQRRSAAICAVAGAMSSDPLVRLQSCMLEAGLASQSEEIYSQTLATLNTNGAKTSDKPNSSILEPLENYREAIFGQHFQGMDHDELASQMNNLFSPIKVLSLQSLWIENQPKGIQLQWLEISSTNDELILSLPEGAQLGSLKGAVSSKVTHNGQLSKIEFKVQGPGICSLVIKLNKSFLAKTSISLPFYSESVREISQVQADQNPH